MERHPASGLPFSLDKEKTCVDCWFFVEPDDEGRSDLYFLPMCTNSPRDYLPPNQPYGRSRHRVTYSWSRACEQWREIETERLLRILGRMPSHRGATDK